MKVLLVSSYIFGYIEHLKPAFTAQNIDAEFLYLGKPPLDFKYKSKAHHLWAFLKKAVGINTKMQFRHKAIYDFVRGKKYDQILVIHPQYLPHKTHILLRSITNRYVTFLFDSMAKMPRQKPVLKHFDTVFSYEKRDCKQYGFEFITNFIPVSSSNNYSPLDTTLDFFNICSLDSRFKNLEAIAKALEEKNLNYEFLVFSKKSKNSSYIKFISKKLEGASVRQKLSQTRGLVDIQRADQQGLSFRVFESLGYRKKLITTNADVVNYDFYNENNILIVDPKNVEIPIHFIESDYVDIPSAVLQKYETSGWISKIFNP
ncbi:hypothetical protein [Leeuwenhoekiella parthenopeia]|uniref:Uncharacterized protein n=1 Tax=Leeuwenhoekiella parthenopeia TaxID=2890320 RepID=A0ABS8GPM2_9FLAO|nr:hypothetical protein [Leeuwenhoekiella parthenopeia]MCC4211111.1 hypothetical protein [Leeuwenhoekiella parthenopeia]